MSIASNFPYGLDDLVSFQRTSFQAVIDANKALAAGLQEMSKELMAVTQASLESAAATGTRFAQVKSVQELVSLQVSGAKNSYEAFVTNSAKFGELGMQVANATFAPIIAHADVTKSKVEAAIA